MNLATAQRPVSGHIIDDAYEAARNAARPLAGLPGSVASYPDTLDQSGLSPMVLDQEQSEACVPHAWAMATYLRGQLEKLKGISNGIPLPSMMYAWVNAQWQLQALQGVQPALRIATNAGTNVSSLLLAAHTSGVVSNDAWPMDARLAWGLDPAAAQTATFDIPPDVDVTASIAKMTGDYGASGSDYPTVARSAIAGGFFPIQAFDVDDSFQELTGTNATWSGPVGPVNGRHMMVADGYRPGWIRYRGSYGTGWGDGGWVWIADSYTASAQARDGAVITAAPTLS